MQRRITTPQITDLVGSFAIQEFCVRLLQIVALNESPPTNSPDPAAAAGLLMFQHQG
jgi:hypothetical protein